MIDLNLMKTILDRWDDHENWNDLTYVRDELPNLIKELETLRSVAEASEKYVYEINNSVFYKYLVLKLDDWRRG